jgi:NADH dehydrogenase (ubiquinone) Fe-S protein 1
LVVGTNIRLISPVLNSFIRSAIIKKNLPVYNMGYFSNFTYFFKHLSTSIREVISFFEGSHWLSCKLAKSAAKKPLFFVNEQFLNKNLVQLIIGNTNIISSDWFGLNFIPPNGLSFNSIYDLNLFSTINENISSNFSIDYLFNEHRGSSNSNGFRIFQGSHGNFLAAGSNIILPSTTFIEKNTLYVNSWNLVQSTKKVLEVSGNSRDD